MFEFFKRMKTVVSSELYALIEKAEDPIKMADQYLREMNHEIEEAEKTTAKVMAEEKLTHRKITDLKLLIEKLKDTPNGKLTPFAPVIINALKTWIDENKL